MSEATEHERAGASVDQLSAAFDRHFRLAVFLLTAVYLLLQAIYIERFPLVMDEFQGAQVVHQLLDKLPYRDVQPYKTVLGYYVQLPALLLGGDVHWHGLMLVKAEMALINAVLLLVAAFALAPLIGRSAVVWGLLLLVPMSTFLERSSALRVDMLTSVFGLASLLLLLRRRPALAGLAVALSFLVSQKGVFFVLAGSAALILWWVFRERTRSALRAVLGYHAVALATLVTYILLWAVPSSVSTVIRATFFSHGDIAFAKMYDISHYWLQTLGRNPFFYGLALVSLARLAVVCFKRTARQQDQMLFVYGLVVVILCAFHRQPWPYFFVLLIPTLFVLNAAFFESLPAFSERTRSVVVVLALAIGVVYPLVVRLPRTLERDSGFQRHMVELLAGGLGEGETYLAGVHVLYDRYQAPPELEWIDKDRLSRLLDPSSQEPQEILRSFETDPPKFVLLNYRIMSLPEPLKGFITGNYRGLWGNILGYAPRVPPGAMSFDLAYAGTYVIEAATTLEIDGRALAPGVPTMLEAGRHTLTPASGFALVLLPDNFRSMVNDAYRDRQPMFPDVYDF
jgi:hypothetical protein